jgi:signal transduction histidine kinase
LTAIRRSLEANVAAERERGDQPTEAVTTLMNRMDRLIEMTNMGIDDLRGYVSGLKQESHHAGSLLPAVRRFAARFREATGIDVRIEAEQGDIRVNDRLAAEVFQMTAEALSNIRRHTPARNALVSLNASNGALRLRIENDGAINGSTLFTPRSISERAERLGGRLHVERLEPDRISIVVEVPL